MTPYEELMKDAEWVRNFARDDLELTDETRTVLLRIADHLEIFATISFTPGQELERKVEKRLAQRIESGDDDDVVAALWLLNRTLRSSAGKNFLGAGIAGFASALGASMGSSSGKSKP